VTAEPAARPLSLRSHLRELQRELDDAAAEHFAHRQACHCREGSGCTEGRQLAAVVADKQFAIGMTRFLNEAGDAG
jgi:hypothetical protein